MAFAAIAVEVELAGRGNGWTALTSDVLTPLSIKYGIAGAGPGDRTASSGRCKFALNNAASNSAGTLGYYSPRNANALPGWAIGIRVRVRIQDPASSTWYTRFHGFVHEILPSPGRYTDRTVLVEAGDWIEEAARSIVSGVATQISKRSDELITTLIANAQRQPDSTSISTGRDTYAYALDSARDENPNAILKELSRVTNSELGFLYQLGTGAVVFEARSSRINTVDAATFDDTMVGLVFKALTESMITRMQVVAHPRTVDVANVVLYQLQSVVTVPVGASITLLGPYTDPNNRASRVGGVNMVAPIATTDYLANSASNGSGTDLTASFSWTASLGGNGVRWAITNNSAVVGYITRLQARGIGVYDYENTIAEETADATAIAQFGGYTTSLDMVYQNDPTVSISAARYLLLLYGSELIGLWSLGDAGTSELGTTSQLGYYINTSLATISVAPKTAAMLTQILSLDIGSRIAISETVTGASGAYYIQSIEMRVSAPGYVTVTYGLSPADTTVYWSLGVANFGELGDATRVSYA